MARKRNVAATFMACAQLSSAAAESVVGLEVFYHYVCFANASNDKKMLLFIDLKLRAAILTMFFF